MTGIWTAFLPGILFILFGIALKWTTRRAHRFCLICGTLTAEKITNREWSEHLAEHARREQI